MEYFFYHRDSLSIICTWPFLKIFSKKSFAIFLFLINVYFSLTSLLGLEIRTKQRPRGALKYKHYLLNDLYPLQLKWSSRQMNGKLLNMSFIHVSDYHCINNVCVITSLSMFIFILLYLQRSLVTGRILSNIFYLKPQECPAKQALYVRSTPQEKLRQETRAAHSESSARCKVGSLLNILILTHTSRPAHTRDSG